MLYKTVIEQIRQETGRNIVAWSANNRGNGDCNLHVAELRPGIPRADRFAIQTGIIASGYTSHWKGNCSKSKILKAIGG